MCVHGITKNKTMNFNFLAFPNVFTASSVAKCWCCKFCLSWAKRNESLAQASICSFPQLVVDEFSVFGGCVLRSDSLIFAQG